MDPSTSYCPQSRTGELRCQGGSRLSGQRTGNGRVYDQMTSAGFALTGYFRYLPVKISIYTCKRLAIGHMCAGCYFAWPVLKKQHINNNKTPN